MFVHGITTIGTEGCSTQLPRYLPREYPRALLYDSRPKRPSTSRMGGPGPAERGGSVVKRVAESLARIGGRISAWERFSSGKTNYDLTSISSCLTLARRRETGKETEGQCRERVRAAHQKGATPNRDGYCSCSAGISILRSLSCFGYRRVCIPAGVNRHDSCCLDVSTQTRAAGRATLPLPAGHGHDNRGQERSNSVHAMIGSKEEKDFLRPSKLGGRVHGGGEGGKPTCDYRSFVRWPPACRAVKKPDPRGVPSHYGALLSKETRGGETFLRVFRVGTVGLASPPRLVN